MQRRLRNVQKSVMYLQSSGFTNLNLLPLFLPPGVLFDVAVDAASAP